MEISSVAEADDDGRNAAASRRDRANATIDGERDEDERAIFLSLPSKSDGAAVGAER